MLTCVGYVWDLYLQSIYILHHFAEQFWSLAKAADFTLRRCRPPSDLGARSQATRFHGSFSWDQVGQGDIYILLYIHYVRRQQFLFCIRINVCCESMYDLIPHTIQLLRIPANDEQCIVCVQLDNSQVPLSCESM